MSGSSPAAEIFSERLTEARKRQEWSQAELAKRTSLQPAAISHFETGARKPSFDNLKKLSEALSVTSDYLIGRSDDPNIIWKPDDPLFRHVEKLSDADREHAVEYLQLLAKRRRNKK